MTSVTCEAYIRKTMANDKEILVELIRVTFPKCGILNFKSTVDEGCIVEEFR